MDHTDVDIASIAKLPRLPKRQHRPPRSNPRTPYCVSLIGPSATSSRDHVFAGVVLSKGRAFVSVDRASARVSRSLFGEATLPGGLDRISFRKPMARQDGSTNPLMLDIWTSSSTSLLGVRTSHQTSKVRGMSVVSVDRNRVVGVEVHSLDHPITGSDRTLSPLSSDIVVAALTVEASHPVVVPTHHPPLAHLICKPGRNRSGNLGRSVSSGLEMGHSPLSVSTHL
ncbi:hypothetical protein BDP55DRAFT_663432 [Colletotrichum godetiae]|uniref:Uncharacterized protein n=1 Tax=Colletotrichum godetiae TaxID=1209918 RepID=A0AAJ0ET11_9PEZI|nr:uncharacterized protein BDP55DRAFT_663432 [Colletotrichum godetiae]KAK1675681.1 hypothetical protein BDP55DRAFT_663432 [Colletotrichum godetiae]